MNQHESESIIESALHEYKAGIGIFSEKCPELPPNTTNLPRNALKRRAQRKG